MEYEHQLAQIRDTVVQSLSEGLIFIDFEGTIIYANNMALSILDMDEERMLRGEAEDPLGKELGFYTSWEIM